MFEYNEFHKHTLIVKNEAKKMERVDELALIFQKEWREKINLLWGGLIYSFVYTKKNLEWKPFLIKKKSQLVQHSKDKDINDR